jgi:hypothetical protein
VQANEAAVAIAEFTDPAGHGGIYGLAAALYRLDLEHDDQVVFVPWDLRAVVDLPNPDDHPPVILSSRAKLLHDILVAFGQTGLVIPVPVAVPDATFAAAAYPNPFNPRVAISYSVPRAGRLTAGIYDLRGRLVTTLHDGPVPAGRGELIWTGRDGDGRAVSAGVYFCDLRTADHREVLKLALVR